MLVGICQLDLPAVLGQPVPKPIGIVAELGGRCAQAVCRLDTSPATIGRKRCGTLQFGRVQLGGVIVGEGELRETAQVDDACVRLAAANLLSSRYGRVHGGHKREAIELRWAVAVMVGRGRKLVEMV